MLPSKATDEWNDNNSFKQFRQLTTITSTTATSCKQKICVKIKSDRETVWLNLN